MTKSFPELIVQRILCAVFHDMAEHRSTGHFGLPRMKCEQLIPRNLTSNVPVIILRHFPAVEQMKKMPENQRSAEHRLLLYRNDCLECRTALRAERLEAFAKATRTRKDIDERIRHADSRHSHCFISGTPAASEEKTVSFMTSQQASFFAHSEIMRP